MHPSLCQMWCGCAISSPLLEGVCACNSFTFARWCAFSHLAGGGVCVFCACAIPSFVPDGVCVPARVLCTPGSLTVCNGCPGAQGLAVQSGPLGVSHCLPVRPTQSFTLLNEWTDVYPAMMCNWTAGATATRASLPWPLPTCVGGVVGVHCRASVLSLWGGGVWCIAEHSGVAVLGCAR